MLLLTIHRGLAVVATGMVLFVGGLAICMATPLCSGSATPSAEPTRSIPVSATERAVAPPEKRGIQHVDETTFDDLVLNAKGPVLVDFYADWCAPCRKLTPVLEELAEEMPEATIVKVNVDHSPRLAAAYGVNAIPNVKVFRDGEVAADEVGLVSKGRLRALLSDRPTAR
jgi:thioredoxin 1